MHPFAQELRVRALSLLPTSYYASASVTTISICYFKNNEPEMNPFEVGKLSSKLCGIFLQAILDSLRSKNLGYKTY